MDPRHDYVQKILLEYINFPDTDDSDSDFDPDEYESTDSDEGEFDDSEEEPETDLSHLDPANIITNGLYPHEKDPYHCPPGPLQVETVTMRPKGKAR